MALPPEDRKVIQTMIDKAIAGLRAELSQRAQALAILTADAEGRVQMQIDQMREHAQESVATLRNEAQRIRDELDGRIYDVERQVGR